LVNVTFGINNQTQYGFDTCESCIDSGNLWCSLRNGCLDLIPFNNYYFNRANCGLYVTPDIISSCTSQYDRPPPGTLLGVDAFPYVRDHTLNILNEIRIDNLLPPILPSPPLITQLLYNMTLGGQIATDARLQLRTSYPSNFVGTTYIVVGEISNLDAWSIAREEILYSLYGVTDLFVSNTTKYFDSTFTLSTNGQVAFFWNLLIADVKNDTVLYNFSSCDGLVSSIPSASCSGAYWTTDKFNLSQTVDISAQGYFFQGDLVLSNSSHLKFDINDVNAGTLVVSGCIQFQGTLQLNVSRSLYDLSNLNLIYYACHEGQFDNIKLTDEDECLGVKGGYTETQFSLTFTFVQDCGESSVTLIKFILICLTLLCQ